MNFGTIARRSAGTSAAIAALLVLASAANADVTPVFSTACSDPTLSQPFLSWHDSTCYALAPGEASDNFSGDGWTLSGGANVISATLYDGTQGDVLDLPSGGSAVSPPMWVNSVHPYLRAMLSSANHGAAKVSIAYLGVNGFGSSRPTGALSTPSTTWTLSNQLKLPGNPPNASLQLVQLTLLGTGGPAGPTGPAGPKPGDTRIYNLYYQTASSTGTNTFSGDPRMKH